VDGDQCVEDLYLGVAHPDRVELEGMEVVPEVLSGTRDVEHDGGHCVEIDAAAVAAVDR
jgi:hypothetical protein